MWFSPELQRNLWLQFSWGRLLAAPILLGVMVAAVLAAAEPTPTEMAEYARWAYVVLLAFWSTRRVADALAEEIGGGTWEGQRMSGLSAWSMMWGKLIGGAIFPWYCALICLGVMIWYGVQAPADAMRVPLAQQVGTLLIAGLLGQAASLTIALVLLRKSQSRRRLTVTIAQIVGLLAFGIAVGWDYSANPWAASVDTITWYGRSYDAWQFYAASALVFTIWVLLAVWRLMRVELLYVNRPWVWLLFVAFLMAYVAGFAYIQVEIQSIPLAIQSMSLAGACQTGIILTYLAFLAEPKDPVRYRWGLARLAALQWWRALEFLPLWVVSYVVTVIVGLAAIWSIWLGGTLVPEESWAAWLVHWVFSFMIGATVWQIAAMLIFVLRDMLFLLWLNFGPFRGRADATGIVALVVAYIPLPMVLAGAGLVKFVPAVTPFVSLQSFDLIWPAAEALVIAILLLMRWRRAAHIDIAPDREEPQMHKG